MLFGGGDSGVFFLSICATMYLYGHTPNHPDKKRQSVKSIHLLHNNITHKEGTGMDCTNTFPYPACEIYTKGTRVAFYNLSPFRVFSYPI